jgi:chorismate mutase / prephenate dehydratase
MPAANIEDEPENTTRFLVVGGRSVPPTAADKTSVLMSAMNRPGALFNLLEPIARRGISMTRIESRPARSGVWEYVFFLDIEGHQDDPNVADALEELRRNTSLCKVLGSYPRAIV